MTSTVVAVEDLVAAYNGAPALSDVSFSAERGQSVCVLGPNGGGKTTLFRVLLGELEPVAGRIDVSGRPAYVAQTERTRLDFPVTALDVTVMGTLTHGRWWLPRAAPIARPLARRSTASVSPSTPASASASCRAASASARCSRGRSCRTLRCCCSTSRSRESIRQAPP